MRNPDVIGIGVDLIINRDQFRFAYVRGDDETATFSVVIVFAAGSGNGELSVRHPEADGIDSLDEAREVLHRFHQLLATLT